MMLLPESPPFVMSEFLLSEKPSTTLGKTRLADCPDDDVVVDMEEFDEVVEAGAEDDPNPKGFELTATS